MAFRFSGRNFLPETKKEDGIIKKILTLLFICCAAFMMLPTKAEAKIIDTTILEEHEENSNITQYIPLDILSENATKLFTPEFTEQFLEICREYNIDYLLVIALIEMESEFDPDAVNGTHYGLCQISGKWHSDRAKELGVDDLYDPIGNVLVGVDYLNELLGKDKGVTYALMAYRLGEGAAKNKYAEGKSIPYSDKIETRMKELKNALEK